MAAGCTRQYCKTTAALSQIAEKFMVEDEQLNESNDDMMSVLQQCLDTLEAYQDEYKKLKSARDSMKREDLFEIYESAYVYYKIVHNTVLNKVPHLEQFKHVKKQANNNDKKLMEIYNMLVESLLRDEKISQIKHFLKANSKPENSHLVLDSGAFISVRQLKDLLLTDNDSTLLIDIRTRSEFNQCHIDCKNIICIEPISFKNAYTDIDIEKRSMITSPQREIDLFRMRSNFRCIVLYTSDIDERNRTKSSYQQEMVLLDLLINRSYAKPLDSNTKVVVLKAGISNWISNGGTCTSEGSDSTDDQVYLKGDMSSFNLRNFPKLSPSISSSMDSSMNEMLSSPKNGINEYYRPRQQPPPSSFKNSFPLPPGNHTTKSPQSIPTIAQMPNNIIKFTQYPDAPHLLSEEGGRRSLEKYSTNVSPIISRALTPVNKNVESPQPPKISANSHRANNENPRTVTHGVSKPPSQPIPLLPQLPPWVSSYSASETTQLNKKYDLDFTVGLENMGNSCYINCIVQCLLGTHELTNIFLNNSYEKHINLNSRLGSKGVLAKYFAKLIYTMHQEGSFNYKTKNKPVRPLQFKSACGSINSLFKGSGQQDCQEFCQFLLDGLHEDLNQCGNNPPLKELSPDAEKMRERLSMRIASSIEWERFLTTDFSVIVDLFQGQYASRLRCEVCGLTSTTYQPFTVLSVPVAHTKSCSILDSFNEFTKIEKLDVDEQWSCPDCKKKQPSTKKLTITRLPRNLVIHLKRFDNRLNKNNVFVKYPFILDLTSYWANDFDGQLPPGVSDELPTRGQVPPFTYKLYAVASHSGSLYGGHYTAYVDKGSSRGWYYFDDTSCRPVRSKTECITSNAYVLFYHRVYGV